MKRKKDAFVNVEGERFPGKTYVDQVLRHVFEGQRDYLRSSMFAIHYAHVIMLTEQHVLSLIDAQKILRSVYQVEAENHSSVAYDEHYEDFFFFIEDRIRQVASDEIISNMHIGRSRNDMGVAMYRMVIRTHILEVQEALLTLADSILEQSYEHATTIIPAYTHTQPAQPTTLGHYLLAIYDVCMRDLKRLQAAFTTINRSPMGAAALATTGFPINRERICELLGFEKLVENSYDAIAGADYLAEAASAMAVCMLNCGRWIQDFLLLATKEFNGIIVADPYVQISSIMPQKRNPVSIEHARALASGSYAEALAVLHMIHNTPFGDIVDTEDDLQPYLYNCFAKAKRVFSLMQAVIRTITINKDVLKERASKHAITITELADEVTRKGIPFRRAHEMAATVAKACAAQQKELYEFTLTEVNTILAVVSLTYEEWDHITSPESFINRRNITGGPALQEIQRMLQVRREEAKQHQERISSMQAKIQHCATHLRVLVQQYVK
ncbi:argininosuccinate lyase [Ectobacillus sp. JY-23]|uniref:argininosuccinate lyase n=1 Tax=Ectobacillus sp. JY-23 TaxID=2933872 RepID=UPI001FF11682|nr:argininosuccinate lyase [Ectobacillus sp. JY-23]UOY93189.1 argininosuccinate lyase [Ectobacillus sp. JY-23]